MPQCSIYFFHLSSFIWANGSVPAALASLLLDPPEPQIIGKTQSFATFLPFRASPSSFFWLFLFSDLLSSTIFYSSLLSDSSPLCFSSVHILGSLTSKFPSIIYAVSIHTSNNMISSFFFGFIVIIHCRHQNPRFPAIGTTFSATPN